VEGANERYRDPRAFLTRFHQQNVFTNGSLLTLVLKGCGLSEIVTTHHPIFLSRAAVLNMRCVVLHCLQPDAISGLKLLIKLDVSDNQLSALPQALEGCGNLEVRNHGTTFAFKLGPAP